jgi:hypothetical protein
MDSRHHTAETQVRFNRLVRWVCRRNPTCRLIEKTPHNIARIGFLERLVSKPVYVHIVRNGVDVARSVSRLASHNEYRIVGKSHVNQWWGRDESKWRTLALEGAARGYFPDEVPLIDSHVQRGAYEWLVSLGEADRWRTYLGERLHEVTYTAFTTKPAETLVQLCDFLELATPRVWLDWIVAQVRQEQHSNGPPLELPPAMCERFNAYQTRYGFRGEASSIHGKNSLGLTIGDKSRA